jgi:hypothetical protein
MNHSIDQSHRDPDLFGLLYGFVFVPVSAVARSIRPPRCSAFSNRTTAVNSSGCT